jgi:hypothetical protein
MGVGGWVGGGGVRVGALGQRGLSAAQLTAGWGGKLSVGVVGWAGAVRQLLASVPLRPLF